MCISGGSNPEMAAVNYDQNGGTRAAMRGAQLLSALIERA